MSWLKNLWHLWKRWRLSRRLPPSFMRGAKGLAIAFCISGLVLWGAYHWTASHYAPLYKIQTPQQQLMRESRSPTPPWAITPQRVILILDAVSAGIVAFALLGAFTFLVSLKRPEEETIDDRVAYLYSSKRNGSQEANRYLKEQVTLLGAMVSKAMMTYTYMELSIDKRFIRCHSKVEMEIVNMMELDTYRQKMPLRVGLDSLDGFAQDIGIMHFVDTTECNRIGAFGVPKHHLEKPSNITNTSPVFEMKIDLEIPPGGCVRYEYSWDAWANVEDTNYCGANRFIEQLKLKIYNQFGGVLLISPHHPDHRVCETIPSERKLNHGEEYEIDFTAIPPTSDVAFATRLG